MDQKLVLQSVVKVGPGGRGFIVDGPRSRMVITAAHCLPFFPPRASFSLTSERTYRKLLAPLDAEPIVWAECMFVDPIADIAVLGPPDNQALSDQWDAYVALVEDTEPISITGMESKRMAGALVLSLENSWVACTAIRNGGPLWLEGVVSRDGMSGSPVLTEKGSAIGIVCTGAGLDAPGGPNPYLIDSLPGWMLACR